MEPINYLAQVADPFAQATQGLKLGMGMADLQRQQEARAAQQQQAQLAAQEQARFFANPKPTMRDAARFASLLSPEQSKAFLPYMEGITKEQQQGFLKTTGNLMSLLETKPELFIQEANKLAQASRNSGDEADAVQYEQMATMAAEPQDRSAIFVSLAAKAAPIQGSKEMFEAFDKARSTAQTAAQAPAELRQKIAVASKAESDAQTALATAKNAPERAAAEAALATAQADKAKAEARYKERDILADLENKAANLGLTKAQTGSALAQTNKLGVETKEAVLRLKALENGTGDPKEKFSQEEKIRKEWQGRSKVYGELQNTFNTLQASAGSANGPGDIALITGFMKMLDPGSVVRETEFATARDTAGLFTQLENRLQKAKDGQLLSPAQRKEYVALSQKYLESAKKKAAEERKDLGIVVKNYKLNPQNVFGLEAEPAAPTPLPASATVGGKTYPRPASFTDTQWRDYLKANGVIQ
jgi:hypothetical protein